MEVQATAWGQAKSAAAGQCRLFRLTGSSADRTRAVAVSVHSVKRAKQYVARKELQKQAKHEYLKQFYESADRVEADHLVYELKPSSPRVRAQQQQQTHNAQLNRQLVELIPELTTWQQLQGFMQQHSSTAHFLTVTALAAQAAAVHQAVGPPAPPGHASLLPQLAALVLQASSWFQPAHFAAAADAMCACGLTDPAFWDNLTAAAEHKVGAFSFQQLAQVLSALATVGFTPPLAWVERCYRQASKHLHAADPADVCVLMWAWGELGYTPRDRLFMNQVKIITRRAFDTHTLTGQQLVQLMHGLARMPKYAPNQGWLMALAKEVQRNMMQLAPGVVVDLLLSLVALGFQPPEWWMTAALERLQQGFTNPSSSSSSSQAGWANELLLLPPPDMLQQQRPRGGPGPAGMNTPGLLVEQQGRGEGIAGEAAPGAGDLQQLQDMFAAAATGDEQDEAENLATEVDSSQQQQQALSTTDSTGSSSSAFSSQQEQHLSAEHLGVLCWCLGRLDYKPRPDWMQLLGQQLLLRCEAASAEVLVDVLLGLATIGYMPVGKVQQALLARAVGLVPNMQPEGLARLCQALVGLEQGLTEAAAAAAGGQQSSAALDGVGASAAAGQLAIQVGSRGRSARSRGSSSDSSRPDSAAAPGDETSSSSYLEQYQQQHKLQLAGAVAHRQGIILWQSSTQQLADVFAFLAASGLKPSPEYMATGVSRAVEKLPEGAPAASICTLLWALARLGFKPHPQLLHQLLAALQRGLHLLSSQDLADAGWALCALKHRPGASWLGLYMQQVASKASYMSPQALTDTLWALACFAAQPDREWLKRVVVAVGGVQLSQRNAAVVVWALQQLGFQPQQMVVGQAGGDSAAAGGEVERAVAGLMQAVLQQQQPVALV